ncbi:hypothetical protein L6452_18558 [Arctium lappa]|uniref:Uncharacterized protein n=1 Tax=Arctium lappa TaxID=4217 RepID=A0ACB9C6E3_ARCLA|nr:hypothetical protein L6452_18558 [Arctium lappa]
MSLHKGTHQRRRRFKDEELVWKKKPVEDELKERESCVHASNVKKNKASEGKPDHIYSRDQLLRVTLSMMSEFEKIRIYTFHELTDTQIKERRISYYHKGEIKECVEIEEVLMIMMLTIIKKGEKFSKFNFKVLKKESLFF